MSSSSSSSASDSERSTVSPSHPRKRQKLSEDAASSHDTDSSDESSDAASDSGSNSDQETDEDAPVLSHADKRRQKRKEKLVVKSSEDKGVDKKGKRKVKNTAELAPSKVPKRQNSIWVGNLSFKTTPAALKNFFEGVGEITRVHMPMKMATGGPEGPRKENRGFAYVDFETPDSKTVAITLSENHLDGRRLLIKDGDDFKGRPTPTPAADGAGTPPGPNSTGRTKTAQKILSAQKQPPGPTLFLGNLGFETTAESIRELFESHRAKEASAAEDDDNDNDNNNNNKNKWIRKVRLGTFEDSGKCKGWAFVDFATTEHATVALTNPRNHHLNGRTLVVEYASPEAVRRGGGGGPPRADKTDKTERGGSRGGGKRDRPRRREGATEDGNEGGVDDEERGPPLKKRRSVGGDEGKPRGGRELKGDSAGKGHKGTRPRSKPGAALALAKREDVSIVPSQGKKIVF